MSSPWKDLRTGTYYLRRGVPSDIRGVTVDGVRLGSIYKRSLQTKDPAEAKLRFPVELAKCDRLFSRAHQKLTTPALSEISREEAERLADAWYAAILEEDEEVRMEGLDERDMRKLIESIDVADVGLMDALARGDTSSIEGELDIFLDDIELDVETDSQVYRQLAYALLKAMVKAGKDLQQRQQGEPVDTPEVPEYSKLMNGGAIQNQDDGSLSITEIYRRWKLERKPDLKLEMEWDKAIRRFTEVHEEDLSVTDITRRHVATFKDALFQLPTRLPASVRKLPMPEIIRLYEHDENIQRLKAGSVKKDLTAIQAVLSWAVDNGYIDFNPADRLKIREGKGAKSDDRLPYDKDDLQQIFSSPVFSEGVRPRGGCGEAAYWIPYLALYTGARLDEMGQLRVGDVHITGDTSWIHLNTIDEGKRLKNKGSERSVPIHPRLIELGFLEFVEKRTKKSSKKALLFHELKPDNRGKLTGNWSKWWGRYAREKAGITSSRKVFHSFRHTFKDACRAAGIEEAIHDALTGHSSGHVGRGYGQGYTLEILSSAIRKIDNME